MTKRVKVGIVGCGYWGPNLVRNFRSLPDCSLKVMCDLSEQRLKHLKTLYPEVEGATDYHHVLNGLGLDAVIIATPVRTHFPMAKAALLAGKHTFIEKPMASSSARMRGADRHRQEERSGADDRPHVSLFTGGPKDQGNRARRATLAKSATSAPAG